MITNCGGNATTGITAATDRFFPPLAAGNTNSSSSPTARNIVPGAAGTKWRIGNFILICDAGPGVGLSRTFVLQIDDVDTSILITLSGAGTGLGVSIGSNVTDFVTMTAGQTFSLRSAASGVTTSTGVIRWCFSADGPTSFVMAMSNANPGNAARSWMPLMGADTDPTAELNMTAPMPTSGTFRNMQMMLSGSPGGAGKEYKATLLVDGATTVGGSNTPNATCAGTTVIAAGTDAVHVNQGQKVVYQIDPTGTPTARNIMISMEWVPDVAGETILLYCSATLMQTGSTRYWQPIAGGNTTSTTESTRQILALKSILKKLFVATSAAPGSAASGKSYKMTMFNNASGTGQPNATVLDTATTANDTTTESPISADGTTLSFQMIPTGTPTAVTLGLGVVLYIPPANQFFAMF